ncbi:hypothetical protein, partial [Schlesneria sp.]|uniref:hypothetical protein n=1 Tax=Schlesneria sp. TaxID=2762018 RepID=UPI002F1C1F82
RVRKSFAKQRLPGTEQQKARAMHAPVGPAHGFTTETSVHKSVFVKGDLGKYHCYKHKLQGATLQNHGFLWFLRLTVINTLSSKVT